MKKFLALLIACTALVFGQDVVPSPTLNTIPVSKLPHGPATARMLVWVTDGATASDCSTGGGSYQVLCMSNGSSWYSFTSASLTVPAVSNILKGDGAGNAADTKVAITSPTTAATIAFAADNESVTLPNGAVPGCSKYTVPYSNAAFQAAATTADVSLFTLPARAKLLGVNIKSSTAFAGTGITSTTVSVGNALH